MFELHTVLGWFALIGGIFILWFIVLVLFAPAIDY